MAKRSAKVAPSGYGAAAQRSFVSRCCTGDVGCVLNTLFFPCVSLYQACLIYTAPCLWIYTVAFLDAVFCSLFRLICCACCFRHTDKAFPASQPVVSVPLVCYSYLPLPPDADSPGSWLRYRRP